MYSIQQTINGIAYYAKFDYLHSARMTAIALMECYQLDITIYCPHGETVFFQSPE